MEAPYFLADQLSNGNGTTRLTHAHAHAHARMHTHACTCASPIPGGPRAVRPWLVPDAIWAVAALELSRWVALGRLWWRPWHVCRTSIS